MNGNTDLRQRDKPANGLNGKVPNGQEEVQLRDKKASFGKKISNKVEHVQDTCTTCCIPCLVSHNPLPDNPTRMQRLKHAFMLPLHGNIASYIQFVVICIQLWIVLYSLTLGEALPGGNLYSLLILFICCAIGGYLISLVRLPPLLGMLIVGVMLRNIPKISIIGESIDVKWSGALRKIALTVILTRAGLGLDIVKLKKLSFAVLRLAFIPCTCEIITVGIVSHFILGFPWTWSLMLGCILGALSPAVTVPNLVNLQDRKYGVEKGIPTMLLAAGGLDNVLCVTAFSVFMGIIFSEGDLAITSVKGPLGVFVGIVYGFVAGIFLWYIPSKDCINSLFYRSLLLIGFGTIAIFGSSIIQLSGAGPLGCLTTATVAGYKWRQRRKAGEQDEVSGVMAVVWLIAQHFLFGLIGAVVDISKIESSTAGWGILTLAIGLVVRSAVDFTVTLRTGFNLKERIFITLTWLSKATVQAAIGGLALDKVRESDNPDPTSLKYATDILTLSVLAIIICAPVGATLMAVLGPKFLKHGYTETEAIEIVHDKREENKHVEIIDMTQISEEKEMTEISKEIEEEIHVKNEDKPVSSSPVLEVPVQVETAVQNNKEIAKNTDSIKDPGEKDLELIEALENMGTTNSDYPELYKSHLTVTLSRSTSANENESIENTDAYDSPSTSSLDQDKSESIVGFDNPVFQHTEDDASIYENVEKSLNNP